MAGVGHNSGDEADVLNTTAQSQLKSLCERLERLAEDRQAVMDDMKEVFAEAKGSGFDTKIMRKILTARKQDRAKRQEEAALFELYSTALGWDLI